MENIIEEANRFSLSYNQVLRWVDFSGTKSKLYFYAIVNIKKKFKNISAFYMMRHLIHIMMMIMLIGNVYLIANLENTPLYIHFYDRLSFQVFAYFTNFVVSQCVVLSLSTYILNSKLEIVDKYGFRPDSDNRVDINRSLIKYDVIDSMLEIYVDNIMFMVVTNVCLVLFSYMLIIVNIIIISIYVTFHIYETRRFLKTVEKIKKNIMQGLLYINIDNIPFEFSASEKSLYLTYVRDIVQETVLLSAAKTSSMIIAIIIMPFL